MDRDPERLEHRAVDGGEAVRQREEAVLRPGHPLAHRAVVLVLAREADGGAEVRVPLEAERAALARDRGLDRHEPAVLGPAGHLVAGHDRARDPARPDPALLEPVEVRSAEADGLDADQHLAGAGLRALLVVDPDVALAVQSGGAHLLLLLAVVGALAVLAQVVLVDEEGRRALDDGRARSRGRGSPSAPRTRGRCAFSTASAASLPQAKGPWFRTSTAATSSGERRFLRKVSTITRPVFLS